MAQLSIPCFNGVGVGLALRDFILTSVIPKAIISIKGITVIAFGFGSSVDHVLNGLLGALIDHVPAQKAASLSIYYGDDVDPVFLSPMKVNNSSISASSTCSGTGASGSWLAYAFTQFATVW